MKVKVEVADPLKKQCQIQMKLITNTDEIDDNVKIDICEQNCFIGVNRNHYFFKTDTNYHTLPQIKRFCNNEKQG